MLQFVFKVCVCVCEIYSKSVCAIILFSRALLIFLFPTLQLSPHILSGLHEIVRNVVVCNYQQALAVHTHVVSSSNFSEISAFMPVLKVVVTIANKLNI